MAQSKPCPAKYLRISYHDPLSTSPANFIYELAPLEPIGPWRPAQKNSDLFSWPNVLSIKKAVRKEQIIPALAPLTSEMARAPRGWEFIYVGIRFSILFAVEEGPARVKCLEKMIEGFKNHWNNYEKYTSTIEPHGQYFQSKCQK